MKKLLVLAVSALTLSGCNLISIVDNNSSNTQTTGTQQETQTTGQNQTQNTGTSTGGQTESGDSNTGGQTQEAGSSTGGQTGGGQTTGGTTTTGEKDDHIPTNASYPLSDYTTFKFYDEYGAVLAEDWNYYIKTTHKIAGELYNGNNGDKAGQGIIFEDRNSFVVSPKFNSWTKLEVRFEVWFSAKTGNKATHTEGEPQFRIDAYEADGTHLGTTDFLLDGSDVPSNGQCASKKLYMKFPTMSYFVINYDNTIKKGNAIYCPVFHEITLKGWDYE